MFQTARDPILSLFQSAAGAVAAASSGPDGHALPLAAAHVVALHTGSPLGDARPPVPAASLDCASLGLLLLRALVAGPPGRAAELRDRLAYSACDPRWAETLVDYARLFLPDGRLKPVPYRRHATLGDFVVTAPAATQRIALISDWGTGTRTARDVAALLAAQRPDAVIHLGDIYFAGTPEECDRHFLAPLREVLPDTPLFTLCGNHDVYSGGEGYYGLLDRIGQPASYFCLRSPDGAWQFLAADTGLHDRNPFDETAALTFLEPGEEAWHADKLRGFAGRTIFLSHHQPFSAIRQIGDAIRHSAVNPNLMASHARLSAAGRIDAWFWGHEHRLQIYAPYQGVTAGRNIGYGAVPVSVADTAPLAGLADPPALLTRIELDGVDGAYTHGFALLEMGVGVDASYWALTRPGGPVFVERLAGEEGRLLF